MEGGEGRVAVPAVLAARYEVGRLLSESPACRVHEARDVLLERDVVVKVAHGLGDDGARSRAVRAARAAARARNPHVVRVLDVHHGPPAFLVLEVLDARPLDVHEVAVQPAQRVLALGDELLAGLAALHAVGAVHGDVRAENVLLTTEGRVVLTSTGIARAAQGAATVGSDVVAAGALLRRMLAAQAPPGVDAVLARAGDSGSPGPGGYPGAGAFRAALRAATGQPRREDAASAPAPVPASPRPAAVPPPRVAEPVGTGAGPTGRGLVAIAAVAVVVVGLGLFAQRLRTTSAPTPSPAPPTAAIVQPPPSETSTANPSPTLPAPAPGTALDELLARADLPVETEGDRELLVQLRELQVLEGAERATRAAALLGLVVEGTRDGDLSRAAAREAFDALASEVTLEGLVALGEGDPAAGPGGAAFVGRLRALGALEGAQRGREAVALFGLASSAESGLAGPFRAAASAALLREVTLEGLVALGEGDPAAAGPGGAAFVGRLGALEALEGAQRAGEAAELLREVDASGGELAPAFRAAAVQVLRPIAAGAEADQTGTA